MNIETSQECNELFAALAEAQAEIGTAAKGTSNPFFKSKYADLASVWAAVQAALPKHGLSVSQFPVSQDPELVSVVTVLGHKSGQWMRGTLTMRPVKPDPQGIGSATTYARRYALAAVAGVAPEDDDGERASSHEAAPPPCITEHQLSALRDLCAATETDEAQFAMWLKVDSLENLPARDYQRAAKALEKKAAKAQAA
jgi:hypothetical protein